MGQPLKLKDFTTRDYQQFSIRLNEQLEELKAQIQGPSFHRKHLSLGAELEVYLVDDKYAPACVNQELLELVNNPCLTLEINRYNLELNLTPVETQSTSPFSLLEKEMRLLLDNLQSHAQSLGVYIIPIGILPTLKQDHLTGEYMTNQLRYHALKESLCGASHRHYKICISGKDRLVL